MNGNEIEIQLIQDDFGGVNDLVPSIIENLLNHAESMVDVDIIAYSSSIIAVFCILKRSVDAFKMSANEYDILSSKTNEIAAQTRLEIVKEYGSDHPYVSFIDRLAWT